MRAEWFSFFVAKWICYVYPPEALDASGQISRKETVVMTETLGQYVSAKELGAALGLSRSAIFGLVRRGVLPQGILLGHSRRWSVEEVKQALSNMKGEKDE